MIFHVLHPNCELTSRAVNDFVNFQLYTKKIITEPENLYSVHIQETNEA